MAVIDLVVRAHEIHRGMISEHGRVAVVPLAVQLDEIPVVTVAVNRDYYYTRPIVLFSFKEVTDGIIYYCRSASCG